MSKPRKQIILTVDDSPENVGMVNGILKDEYQIKVALDGESALKIASSDEPPALILLDIVMPEMDGYEVCRALKENPLTKDIPVIFVTAKDEVTDETKGLEIGAVDYITKPISAPILKARIETHLKIHNQKREIERSYEALKRAEGARDALSHMIVHDLNNPLTAISGGLQLLLMKVKKGNFDSEKFEQYLTKMQSSSLQMSILIRGILDISKLESGEMKASISSFDGADLLREVAEQIVPVGDEEKRVTLESPAELFRVKGDRELLTRVLQNLVNNALKHTASGTKIHCSLIQEDGQVIFSVTDQGQGIPEEYQDKIFGKFFQIDNKGEKKYGVGLGLAFCKMAVEAQGGRIWVESKVGEGSTFKVAMPGG